MKKKRREFFGDTEFYRKSPWEQMNGKFVAKDQFGYYRLKTGEALHRNIYKKAIGPIPPGWEVHHINCQRDDNAPKNLIALPVKVHKQLHRMMKKQKKIIYDRERIIWFLENYYCTKHNLRALKRRIKELQAGSKAASNNRINALKGHIRSEINLKINPGVRDHIELLKSGRIDHSVYLGPTKDQSKRKKRTVKTICKKS